MLKPVLIASMLVPLSSGPVSTPAAAQTLSQRVSYADLDLSTEAGRDTLKQRIARAARRVCGGDAPGQDISKWAEIRRCQFEAVSGTRLQVARAVDRSSKQQLASR